MTKKLTGGCACGSVQYECGEKPIVQLICHCRDCQRASGSAFAAVMFVPSDRLTFTGTELKWFEAKAASGRTLRRGFCSECGSPVSLRWSEKRPFELLTVSSLDDPSGFSPTCEVWVSRADPWHQLHPDTVKFDEGPSEEAVRAPIAAYFAGRESN